MRKDRKAQEQINRNVEKQRSRQSERQAEKQKSKTKTSRKRQANTSRRQNGQTKAKRRTSKTKIRILTTNRPPSFLHTEGDGHATDGYLAVVRFPATR